MWWLGDSDSAIGSGSGGFNTTPAFDPEENLTLSCAARNIQGPVQQPYNDILVTVVRVCQSILFLLASFGGMLLNAFIVILVAKYKQLHTLSFGIAAHISALDILFSVVVFIAMVNSMANRWLFGEHMCGIVGASILMISTTRTMVMLTFVIDRFLSVFVPFGYPKYQKKVVVILSLGAWLIPLVSVVLGYILDCYEFIPIIWMCFFTATCSRSCSILLGFTYTVVIAPTTIVPVFLYAILYKKARKSRKAMSLATGEDGKLPYDWKATLTFFFMFLAAFLLVLPNILTANIIRIVYGKETLPVAAYLVDAIATRSITFVPVADAILLLRNRDVRDTIDEMKENISQRWCQKAKNK